MDKKFRSSILEYNSSDETNYLTHGIFRWYGKLVPLLVKDVLDLYTCEGDTVVANFNGSGTIAVESMIRNLNVIGTDINPLAILVSKVKTTKLPDFDIEVEVQRLIELSKEIVVTPEDVNNLYEPDKWYSGDTIETLLKLKKAILKKFENSSVKDFFTVCLLSIVRECSNIDSRCVNHIVVDKNRAIPDVYLKFKKECIANYNSIKLLDNYNNTGNIDFLLSDCRNITKIENESVDLVFSHPPYLNAINYYNIHRLSTDLLGCDYTEIRNSDFSSKNHETFLKFMEDCYLEGMRILKPGKRMVVVIGDVRYKGNIIPLGVETVNSLRKVGFDIEDIFIWVLKQKAGMSVARRGNHIDHNFVIVAKKKEEKDNG